MKITNDNVSIKTFKAWSDAVETQNIIINKGKEDDFDNLIEELYPDGLTDTQLNDILWFDDAWIFETLGIDNDEEE